MQYKRSTSCHGQLLPHEAATILAGRCCYCQGSVSLTFVTFAIFQVLVADVSDEASLLAMARSARVVLNCVGPFRYWGEPVVAACVAAGAHYLDICGEPGEGPFTVQTSYVHVCSTRRSNR